MLYINIWLLHLCFSLRKDIFNHKNICCFSFFNNSNLFFIINVYSDNCQSALKYLKDSEVNIWNMIIMAGDFNIKIIRNSMGQTLTLCQYNQVFKRLVEWGLLGKTYMSRSSKVDFVHFYFLSFIFIFIFIFSFILYFYF